MEVHRLSHIKDINIVNSNYNQYGQSVFSTIHSNSILSNHANTANTTHSLTSLSTISSLTSAKRTSVNDLNSLKKRTKFSYRSLLLPEALSVKKFLQNKLDTDSFSIFSSNSRFVPSTINSLPTEIMTLIISYLDDSETTINCLYVNNNFYKAAKAVVYDSPYLTSTYRLAQLVSCLRENPENGLLVKNLDLSRLAPGLLVDEANNGDNASIQTDDEDIYLDYALASWRDWKYKGDPLYGSSLLNSYNLSKSKSTVSVDSLSTVTTMKLKLFKKFKEESNIHDGFHMIKFKKIAHLFKLKKDSTTTATQLKEKVTLNSNNVRSINRNSVNGHPSKNVKFNTRNPKCQPFSDHHPYTNKFLLKYSASKDIPIGYLLYLIDLCPNITDLNLSTISLSIDFKIIYPDPANSPLKLPSLVEDVLPINDNKSSKSSNASSTTSINKKSIILKSAGNKVNLRPNYMSDSNVYFNMKNFQDQFTKLSELDVLNKISNLKNLKNLNLSSISWINYKTLRRLIKGSTFISNNSLKSIDLTDSGMLRDLNWATKFNDLLELKEYFKGEVEPEVESEEDQSAVALRTIGMNY